MTNYTRFATDRPGEWRLVDLDAPNTSPAITVEGDDVQADAIAAALNATQPAPDVTAVVNRILDTLEEQGVALWGCYTDEVADACRADAARVITPLVASLTTAPDLTALREAWGTCQAVSKSYRHLDVEFGEVVAALFGLVPHLQALFPQDGDA